MHRSLASVCSNKDRTDVSDEVSPRQLHSSAVACLNLLSSAIQGQREADSIVRGNCLHYLVVSAPRFGEKRLSDLVPWRLENLSW